MDRAARFEDEKRRIIESCFGKKDVDGSLLETYITHIRITEYSSYPTSPPPPQARTPEAKKPRVIIVAVRKSGRVRMHKSKENPNGSFSIGKTWNLDDLTAIESFTGPPASALNREWAGETGFTVTLGKPYFWDSQSDKEKKFFIASLIKIYGKYTGGRTPELSGFDLRELEQVTGNRRPPPQRSPIPEAARPPLPDQQQPQAPLRASGSAYPNQGSPSPARRPAYLQNGASSPAGSMDSSLSQNQAALRALSGQNKSQESVAASYATRSDDASSIPPRSRNGVPAPGAFPPSRYDTPESMPPASPKPPLPPPEERPPERRRPPMDPLRPQGVADRDLVPAPLMSPGMRREPVAPPPRSMDRMSPRKPSGSQLGDAGSFKDRPVTPGSYKDRPITPGSFKDRPITPAAEPTPPPTVPSIPDTADNVSTRNGSSSTMSSAAVAPPEPPSELSPASPPADQDEASRPGLGPMIKSKKSRGEIAGAFWKAASAASAASAFKPRPGGAGDRLRQAVQTKSVDDGSDGITGVFQPPPKPKVEEPEKPAEEEAPPVAAKRAPEVPSVKVTVPNSSRPSSLQVTVKDKEMPKPPEEKSSRDSLREEASKSIISGNDAKYIAALGVDPSILDNRSTEFTKWLDYFSWVPGEKMRSRHMEDMKVEIDRELNKAQAGGWLARFREDDDRVDAIKKGIDVAMAECDELDNLLTLYSVELSTLSDDIAYIEAQGQGLQVQASNQKILKKELESLLETTAISSSDLGALKGAPLETIDGLEGIETALVTLYQAMIKIDPNLGAESSKKVDDTEDNDQSGGLDNSDYGEMRIVQEKKQMYLQESSLFMRRLVEFMARQFIEAHAETQRHLSEALSRKVDSRHHDAGRDRLWKYSPLILYARDVDLKNWDRLLQLYQDQSRPIYNQEFIQIIMAWKKNSRKMSSEEATDILFTSYAEKKEEGTLTTARKLTVKRSQTLAKSLRNPLDSSSKSNLKATESQSLPYETFGSILDDVLPLVEMEQNFVVDFFHATTMDQTDFPDAVAATRPRDRMGGDLKRHRLMEPDRELARRVTKAMEVIFNFLEQELTKLMEWVLMADSLQGVGVLSALERKMASISQSNQDFLNTMMQKLHAYLENRFKKFVDDQIRAIEETKVKINKRKGVISFIRIFPNFTSAVENILAGIDPNLEVRAMVDREYDRILKSMFDSLKIIARENPAVAVNTGSSADPEDKEALNFHILLIENANHYLEEVDTRGLEVLEEWNANAQAELDEHMRLYIDAVVRRPLGKLLEYLENIEAQLASGKPGTSIAAQPSNSRGIFNKVLGNYDAKEVRKGIETLRKRVEKHFGDADDPALSRSLVAKVLRECERFYGDVELRISRITADVYGGDALFEWPRQEVKGGFATR